MMNEINQIHKGDINAEWHPLNSVIIDGGILCQVCGDIHDPKLFENSNVVTCTDCGLFLEVVECGDYKFIVIFEDPNNPVPNFYDTLKS